MNRYPKRQGGCLPNTLNSKYDVRPGDLCKYLSRTVMVIDLFTRSAGYAGYDALWVNAIEIDENVHRKILADALTLIQRAEGDNNDQRV